MEGGGEGWYMNTPQGPMGPLTEQQLKEYADNGHVLASTHVWREGLPQWDEVAAVPTLRRVLAAATARERRLQKGAAAAAGAEAAAGKAPPPDELEFEDDDGTVYEWDPSLGKYRPKEDPVAKAIAERAAAAAARAAAAAAPGGGGGGAAAAAAAAPAGTFPAYDPADMTYVPDGGDGEPLGKANGAKRRGGEEGGEAGGGDGSGGSNSNKRARPSSEEAATTAPARQPQQQQQQQQLSTTSVYVTGLPEDATEAEVAAAFSRCGVLRLGPDGRPRVRLYVDRATGRPKGDALVCYLKSPSVALAVQILDGAPLRPGRSALPMSVSPARFDAAAAAQAAEGAAAGGGAAQGAPSHQKATPTSAVAGVSSAAAARQRRKERERQERRLLGWDGYDDTAAPASRTTVVLSPMFARDEVRADRQLPKLVERDVADECARRGLRLVRCVAFARHPRGVVTARLATPEDADACVAAMQGRFYGGRRVEAALWDGVTNYRAAEEGEEDEEDEEDGEDEEEGEKEERRRRAASAEDEDDDGEQKQRARSAPERKEEEEEGGGGGKEEEEEDDDDEDARLAAFFGE